jgi:hypothetical protein
LFASKPYTSERADFMKTQRPWIALLLSAAAGTSGCVDLNTSPSVQGKLKAVSAGYTGCPPGDNVLSNVAMHADRSGIWHATCKGKTFLCTAVVTDTVAVNEPVAYHCAPLAQ